ncbi:MAG TPA: hypothetical protein VG890_17280 [Puia sp.]|nr:hypothetical protein [Puia sp.]
MKKDQSRLTVLVISMGFLVVYLKFHWQWAILVSLTVGLIGIFSTYLSSRIEWLWSKLSQGLGYIVPNILLTLVFFIFLFPLALLSRLFKKDPLMLSNSHKSYFVDVNKTMDKKSFEKIW